MGVVAVYIDGGYLERLVRNLDGLRVDFEKLAHHIADPHDLLRVYYYQCPPYKFPDATPEELDFYDKRRRFYTALNYRPKFQVREGFLAYRGTDKEGKPIFQQKMVDVMLAVDMTLLTLKGRINQAALVAGDRDFVPLVEAVKNEGVNVVLWHGSFQHSQARPSDELCQVCDDRHELTTDLLRNFQRD